MMLLAVAFVSAFCAASLQLCQGLRQYPYFQGAYGLPPPSPPQAQPYPPQAQPMYAQQPYGLFPYAAAPAYNQPGAAYNQPGAAYSQPGTAYNQPGAAYDQPGAAYNQPGGAYNQPGAYPQAYVPAFSPSHAAPPSAAAATPPNAAAATAPSQPAEPAGAVESSSKHGERPIQAYLASLLPGAKKNTSALKNTSASKSTSASVALQDMLKQDPAKLTAQQLDMAKQFFTASAKFIGDTARWVNDTKHSNDTAKRFADLLQRIPHKTGKLVEKLAIPVVGNIALDKMGLTTRERMLANVGLATALATTLGRPGEDDAPLLTEKVGNVTAPQVQQPVQQPVEAAVELARETQEGEVPTINAKESYWERTIKRWAHRR